MFGISMARWLRRLPCAEWDIFFLGSAPNSVYSCSVLKPARRIRSASISPSVP